MDYPDASYSQPLRLTYSLHSKTMMESIQSCQRRLCYTDVQLISEGGIVFAHSIVLAGASNFLKHLLISNPDPTIVIHLPGVDYEPLRLLLEVTAALFYLTQNPDGLKKSAAVFRALGHNLRWFRYTMKKRRSAAASR